MEDNQAARSSDKAQKSGKFRALEVIMLYICFPAAVFTLLFIGMKQLMGYCRPTSAWVLIGAYWLTQTIRQRRARQKKENNG